MKLNGLETNTMNDNLWECRIRNADVSNMNEARKAEFISLLNKAVHDVCWKYGVHN
jgi:hypothetical protein